MWEEIGRAMSDHEEIRGLIPAYALDVLDPDESALVQEHLPGCAACRRELDACLHLTDGIALSASEAEPPSGLEAKILREASLMRPRQMARKMKTARIWNPGFAAAAAVLILALAAGNVAQWVRSPQFPARTKGLETVALIGTGDNREAYGTIVVDPQDSEGVLAVRGLKKLASDSSYQLWLRKDGEVRSGGLFAVNEDGYGSLLIKLPGGFRGFNAFSISVEPAAGSDTPRGSPILTGGL